VRSLFSPEFVAYLKEFNTVSILFRFALATLCGSLIGFERGKKRQAAGLRTHIIVCIGATAAMLVNQYSVHFINPASDPARMGAQVVSGIGFLGAGTIVITGNRRSQQVKGLTTAAGLWASACMGLCIGIGFYRGAVIMCAFLFVVIVALNQIDERYLKSSSLLRLYLEYSPTTPFSAILVALHNEGWHMTNIEPLKHMGSGNTSVLLEIQNNSRNWNAQKVLDLVRHVDGVLFVEDI
jgi:putative Mg2+ transporter-C (MgtC) family protein